MRAMAIDNDPSVQLRLLVVPAGRADRALTDEAVRRGPTRSS
jgi:hypothetical protein